MRDAMVGSVIGGLVICALSWAVVAQSASERYPAPRPAREAAWHQTDRAAWDVSRIAYRPEQQN